MALDLRQNFVSAQYLENKMIYFQQILYMDLYLQDLAPRQTENKSEKAIMVSLIQHFEVDFLWNSGIILKTFTHGLVVRKNVFGVWYQD